MAKGTRGYRCPQCDAWYPGEIAVEPGYRVEVAQVIVTHDLDAGRS